MFVMSTYESNGVFTSNTQYGGTSKCVGSNSFKKKNSNSLEKALELLMICVHINQENMSFSFLFKL